jgi:hypothetical protein
MFCCAVGFVYYYCLLMNWKWHVPYECPDLVMGEKQSYSL